MSTEFIKMISDFTERRLLRTMQSLVANKTPCGIFFGYNLPDDARQVVDSLKQKKINLNYICALNIENQRYFQLADGESLVAVKDFPSLKVKPKILFKTKGFFSNMFMDYFGRYGTKMITYADVHSAENLYNMFMTRLPELYAVHEMLADDESKKVFRASIIGKVTHILQDFRFAPEPQYFLNGFLPQAGDIAIDGGAYDGGTATDFAKQGAQVYAFEMDAANYQHCLAPAEKFGFTIENLGLSNQEGEAAYSASGDAGSRKLANLVGEVNARFTDLDSYVARKDLPRVDYIKLDIEGAELDMLHGAAKTITRWKPKMAVSAYHKPEDLWTLLPYIKSLRPDYEFAFRHYHIDCTNYLFNDNHRAIFRRFGLSYFCPSHCEMVLYCR